MNFLLPHPPATIEQMIDAVASWRREAAYERFRVENNLCAGYNKVAIHNAELYDKTADEIEKEIELRKSKT